MPIALIENVGAVGVVSDVDPKKLPSGAWSDGQNVIFDGYIAAKIPGARTVFGSLSSSACSLFYYDTADGAHHFVYAGLSRVYAIEGSTHYEITRQNVSGTTSVYTADATELWTGGVLGGLLFLNNGVDEPQIQSNPTVATVLTNLPNWPSTITTRCACLRAFKNFLVALDVTKSSVRYRQMVKWSSSAEPLTYPGTWDEADTTADAGEVSIAETNGTILDCLPLRDVNILYKDDSVWGMQYIGGNDIFRFYKIFSDVGLLARRCVASFENYHVFLGSDLDVYVHDGNTIRSVGQDRWRNWIRANISGDQYDRCFVVTYPARTEAWIHISTGVDTYCDQVLIWNWRQDTWGLRTVSNVSSAVTGVIVSAEYVLLWSSTPDTWDSVSGSWNELASIPPNKQLVQASPSRLTGLIEASYGTQEFGETLTFYLERTGMWAVPSTDQGAADLQSRKFIRRVRFRTEGSDSSNITYMVSVRNDLSDPISWTSVSKSLDGTAEVTVLRRGRFLDFRIESSDDVVANVHAVEIEYEKSGRYL